MPSRLSSLTLMIEPRQDKWAHALFWFYLSKLLRNSFHGFYLMGEAPAPSDSGPLLLLPNHATWWDGFFFYLINRKLLHRVPYLVMLETELKKNRFFQRLGCYSIRPDSLSGVRESLRFTTGLLSKTDGRPKVLCFFTQGELLPWGVRPLGIKPGLNAILKRLNRPVEVLLMCIRVEMRESQRPDVFFAFNGPLQAGPDMPLPPERLESEMTKLLSDMESRINRGEYGTLIMQGRSSINERFASRRVKES